MAIWQCGLAGGIIIKNRYTTSYTSLLNFFEVVSKGGKQETKIASGRRCIFFLFVHSSEKEFECKRA